MRAEQHSASWWGLLTEYADRRWCPYISIPMTVITLIGVPLLLRDRPSGDLRGLDLPGARLSTARLVALVYGFVQAEPHGWGDPVVLALLVVGVLLLGLFVLVEAGSQRPLLPLRILVHQARGTTFVSVWPMFGFYLFVSYCAQMVLGYSSAKAGMTLLVNAVSTTVGAVLIAGRPRRRVAPNVLITGSLLSSAVGMLILTRLEVDSSHMFPLATATNRAAVELDPADAGGAAAAYTTVQQVGTVFGTALLNPIATSVTVSYLNDHGTARKPSTPPRSTAAPWRSGRPSASSCAAR
ncbi:MFS transporter [Streptomyces clavuligerus]|uniref:Major facilitator superfamily MFS_1 n=2 Tax=Streptomyces clavuligerus TaxID=1901 RepID=E2Q8G5_STRCL|nr:MFS transporter [Streptomyces clavuligerus]EFG05497.1 major facilitator superfamily MFS_1 [Streptomyces clavuligerus]